MTNDEIFAARIARINAGAAHTKGTVFIGQDEQVHLGRREVVKPVRSREVAGNAIYPLSLIGAFGLGLFAVVLGSYARFQLMAGQAELEDADLEMALSGVIGIALSFVLAQMFRLTSKEHKAMQGAGVFVMVCAFHNFAHWAPGPMSLAFSPDYVTRLQIDTPANSARFRGAYFPLFEEGSTLAVEMAPETALPEGDTPAPLGTTAPCAPQAPKVKRIVLDSDKAGDAPQRQDACDAG